MMKLIKRARWVTVGAVALLPAFVSGCDLKQSLLSPQQPGVIGPTSVTTPTGAEALRIGRSQEYVVVPDRGRMTRFEHRLAEVVYLEEKGSAPAAFVVSLGAIKATGSLGFKHEFNPDTRMPEPAF